MSKTQAAFSLIDGKCYLKDLGSSNGTFINNLRLNKAREARKLRYSPKILSGRNSEDMGLRSLR